MSSSAVPFVPKSGAGQPSAQQHFTLHMQNAFFVRIQKKMIAAHTCISCISHMQSPSYHPEAGRLQMAAQAESATCSSRRVMTC